MPHPFPHEYRVKLVWKNDRQSVLSANEQPEIQGGPPPQFDGSSKDWSPEELLLASVQLCLNTTYLALAAKAGVELQSYSSKILGVLDKTKDGIRFTKIQVQVDLASDDMRTAQELLVKAKKYCIISNALNVPVELIGPNVQ